MDPHVAARAAGEGQGALNAYEELLNEDTAQKIEQVEIYIPPGPRLGDIVVEAREGCARATAINLLMDDVTSRCRAAASSASSVRTAPARRRCSG